MSGGVAAIAAERQRQMEVEGWSPEHDDQHDREELARAAVCYVGFPFLTVSHFWPVTWSSHWWKPTDRRTDLVKAGALIAAEIDRLDRLKSTTEGEDT